MIQCDQYVQVAYDNKQKRQNLEWDILLLPKNQILNSRVHYPSSKVSMASKSSIIPRQYGKLQISIFRSFLFQCPRLTSPVVVVLDPPQCWSILAAMNKNKSNKQQTTTNPQKTSNKETTKANTQTNNTTKNNQEQITNNKFQSLFPALNDSNLTPTKLPLTDKEESIGNHGCFFQVEKNEINKQELQRKNMKNYWKFQSMPFRSYDSQNKIIFKKSKLSKYKT